MMSQSCFVEIQHILPGTLIQPSVRSMEPNGKQRLKAMYWLLRPSQEFTALNRQTGDSLYTLPTKSYGFSSPILLGDMIYYGVFNGDLVAVDTKSKSEVWRFQTDEAKEDKMQIINEDGTLNLKKVFANTSVENMPRVFELLFSAGAILSTPAPYENSLIFGTADGHLYAIY